MQCDVFIIICDVVRAENSKLVDNQKLRAQARNTIYTVAVLIFSNYNILGRNRIPGLSKHNPFNI